MQQITEVLGLHRLLYRNGYFCCSCKGANYTKSRRPAADAHDIHLAHALSAAGLKMAPSDPREAFLQRRGVK